MDGLFFCVWYLENIKIKTKYNRLLKKFKGKEECAKNGTNIKAKEFKDADKLLREIKADMKSLGISADIVLHKSAGEIITN